MKTFEWKLSSQKPLPESNESFVAERDENLAEEVRHAAHFFHWIVSQILFKFKLFKAKNKRSNRMRLSDAFEQFEFRAAQQCAGRVTSLQHYKFADEESS